MDLRLATQVLVLQVAVVTLTLGLAGGMLAFFSHDRLASQYEDSIAGRRACDRLRPRTCAPTSERYDATPLTPGPELTQKALANGQLQDACHRDPDPRTITALRGHRERPGHQVVPSRPGRTR